VLLYPLITLAYVHEEWRRFTCWAQRHASLRYSRREYVATHMASIATVVRDGVLSRSNVAVAILAAAGFHALEVGHNSFQPW
jgi:hypothetical protein